MLSAVHRYTIHTNVGVLEHSYGSLAEIDYETANVFNALFTSVFTNELSSDIPNLPIKFHGEVLSNTTISHQEIDQLAK